MFFFIDSSRSAAAVFLLNLRACKNDFFFFIMGTSSLEARNIRFVNSNLSRVEGSKLIPAS